MQHRGLLPNFIVIPITIFWSQSPSELIQYRNNSTRIAKQNLVNKDFKIEAFKLRYHWELNIVRFASIILTS